MEYISAEEFLKQPVGVQKVLIDWWKPSVGDLIGIKTECIDMSWNTITKYKVSCVNEDDLFNYNSKEELLDSFKVVGRQSYSDKTVLLLTEGQLRNFIENKYFCKMMVEYTVCKNILIKLGKINKGIFEFNKKFTFSNNKFDLLKSYWVIACEIAKGGGLIWTKLKE
ncbi:UNVERIFIED_ORG: hypothetical protein B2H93_04335 [Clostridium botulinum]